MAHAHAGIWHPLDVSPPTDRAVTREDEEAYRERHDIDPAPRMDVKAAAYNALSPIARVQFGMIRRGSGKAGAAGRDSRSRGRSPRCDRFPFLMRVATRAIVIGEGR